MVRLLKKTNILILICFVLIVIINFSSLNYYFFQDDWFILNDLGNLNLLTIFTPRSDIIYYRPIGIQSFFLISKSIFGPNPFWFHIIAFGIFLFCVYLIYKLTLQLTGKKPLSYIIMFLYGTASFHFMALSWLSLTWNYIGLAFFLVSLKLLITFQDTKEKKYALGAFIFFLLCLLSSEFALTLPFFLSGIFLARTKKVNKKLIISEAKTLLPYLITIFLYLILRFFIIPLPIEGVYKPQIGLHILKDYIWYFLWTLDLGEMFKYHLNIRNLAVSDEFMHGAGSVLFQTVSLFFIEIALLTYCAFKSLKFLNLKIILISLCLFVLGLAPVITLPNHSYTYYLAIASLPIIYLLSLVVYFTGFRKSTPINKAIAILTVVIWIVLSFSNQEFNHKTHWVAAEEVVSRKITQNLILHKTKTPEEVYIYPSSKLIKLALLDQEAMHFVYGKKTVTKYLDINNHFKAGKMQKLINWDK